jgi:hypothetical protein
VRREGETTPLSQHTTATDAERAALDAARRLECERILLRDRYSRVHAIAGTG